MNRVDIREAIRASIAEIAPEADLEELDDDEAFVQRLGLDSMDVLEIVTRIHERTGVDIPERDYDEVASLEAMVDYIEERRAT